MRRLLVALLVCVAAVAARAAQNLTILQAGPVGEVAQLAEANEIRVVFSEPMVVVGKIPKDVTPPWFHVTPAIKGTFRWSGTTTLIFARDLQTPLPYATKYDVTIDASAKSISGHTLGKPYTFSFITPTIKLLRTDHYRKDSSVVIGMWFNQPVDRDTIAQHLQLRTEAHEIELPSIQPEALARMPKADVEAFNAKLAKARAAAASNGVTVLSFLADDWDKKRWPAKPELVVLQTKPGIPPDTNLQVYLDSELARSPANVRTGQAQTYTIRLEQTFFINGFGCTAACNPEERNELRFRGSYVTATDLRKAIHVVDITDPKHEVPLPAPAPPKQEGEVEGFGGSLDDLGYEILPAHTYLVHIDPSLVATDGQTLGYTWIGIAEYWHKPASISFGGGHGVWESSGGTTLPFFARNYKNVTQWAAPVGAEQLMPTIKTLEGARFTAAPPVAPQPRTLAPAPDRIQSYGINIAPVLGRGGKGLVWAAVEPGQTIERSKPHDEEQKRRATVVQVTNLGVTVKDSPQNALIFVTTLDDGKPVAGASVSIRKPDNSVFWSGTTDAHGLATAPHTLLRTGPKPPAEGEEWYSSYVGFIVIAEKDGDVAYAADNWNEGILPWDFELPFDLTERAGLLRGTVFTDRGVYKLGEEVHFKAVVRRDTPQGMQLLAAGTKLDVVVTDSQDNQVDKRTVALNEWSSTEWTWTLPPDSPLGTYSITATTADERLAVNGEFLVAAYRRPDFRVDVTLGVERQASSPVVAGTTLDGKITGRYLFGGAMAKRPVHRAYTKSRLFDIPDTIADRWPDAQWRFLGCLNDCSSSKIDVESKDQKLDAKGELKLKLPTQLDAGVPYSYMLEGEVTDVSRQKIANRATFRVDPAPWYIGIKTVPFFADAKNGIDTEIVAAGVADGAAVPGVDVTVTLKRVQWNSVRQAEGHGFYTWTSERKEVDAGTFTVTTKAQPVPLHIPLTEGGEYYLYADAGDVDGHKTQTMQYFYASGNGYTAWERYDHPRIELVPEKQTWRPGETAKIMIKSPWEHATALLTTEREGVRTSRQFELTSTQQTIGVPITADDIPNVYVSVLLIKGRTKDAVPDDASDPGKPAFRLGYTDLQVEDASKRLKVTVKANRDEYRPATKARIDVDVKDAQGKPARSEVTLWAVDYGVLSLTAYQTPDVLESIYIHKALQVLTEDSRQMIISRRAMTPKGAADGGGGGRDAGPGMLRKDFRVLAFWIGSIVTDKNGHAKTEITLPESLTTYRIMAVASDRASRFGAGQSEIRINKPVLLSQAYPRFLAVGDKAYFGGVVHSQLKQAGQATVTIKSLDPSVLEFTGELRKTVDIAAEGTAEVRFDAIAKAVGNAPVQMTVSLNGESDAFEDNVPVRILASPETVAAYGDTKSEAKEVLQVPAGVLPGFGGLHVETSSTAMVGLSEGAEYLVTYPYGCAEQRGSAAFALMLAGDLGDAFKLPGIDAPKARTIAQSTLVELEKYQCGDGGFAYWAGDCKFESPYLTSYLLHVFQRGQKLKYAVNAKMVERAYTYLDQQMQAPRPPNEGWWPAYTAWQAFAVKVLVEGGRNEDSHITRLMSYADRMPIFGLAYLSDALIAKGETSGPRITELTRRIQNSILPEAGSAHVEELADPYLLYYWNSTTRSTAIVLDTLTRMNEPQLVRPMVRWLMSVRKRGRWDNTQENAWAMEALVDYYRKYESEVPDFAGVVTVGTESLARDEFRGRSTSARVHEWSMPVLLQKAPAGTELPVTFARQGSAGTLFYLMRLRYASSAPQKEPMNQGFEIERRYTTQNGTKALTMFKAGDLIKVTLKVRNTKERRFVAVTDPIPAGTEPVESWFATTASDLADQAERQESQNDDWMAWWKFGGFDHVERHDDRVDLFATRLSEGAHDFTYMLRATTAGTFMTAPAHAEEMYEPEVFGRTASAVVEVTR
jgi:alpha-2-macroglobulin